ncbi:MAG: FHA domain-containing protein [Caldilinea sp. CFX5]|nr:FHA domain-containing protein [Caldilinea sp. CFX5]
MNKRMRRPIIRTFTVLVLITLLFVGWLPQRAQAQAADEAPLTIGSVETTQFPTVKVTVDGATWPEVRATAPLKLLVDGAEQTILSEATIQQGIAFMVAIDPNNLATAGENRYTQLTGALLDPIENGILLRNQDWLAAYHLLPTGLQSVQEWTQEPNLIFNQIVQNPPAPVQDTPLRAATLLSALQQFTNGAAATTTPRSLLLVSAGAADLAVEEVAAVANELAVRIHVIALTNGANNAAATPLAQLAQATGGEFVVLESPSVLPPLWARLAADHQRRVLTFAATVATPQNLEVRLELPTGAVVSATADPAVFANLPTAPVNAPAAPAAQTVLTRSEVQAPVANRQPAAAPAQSAADAASTTDQTPGAIVIPGLQLAIPRVLLQWSLPVLFLLIGYFVYTEMRERRQQRNAGRQHGEPALGYPAEAIDPRFTLGDHSRALAPNRFDLHEEQGQGGSGYTMEAPPRVETAPKAPPPARVTPPVRPPARPAARPPVQTGSLYQEEDENEATIRPLRMEDEEATYRAQEIEQPVIGYLVRATSDPNLPKELPIYGLSPAPGEVRQIHIGRHSKHNTVVINDKSISREHAVIVQRSGRLYLRDNGSTSGTFLNWKRLNAGEELLLRHNDLISFGQVVYEFRLHGEDEVTIAES